MFIEELKALLIEKKNARKIIPSRRTSTFVELRSKDSDYVLLGLRKDGTWGFPGGGVDKNENVLTAVKREVGEETSLTDIDLNSKKYKKLKLKNKDAYIFKKKTKVKKIYPATKEHERFKWFRIDELPDSLHKIVKRYYKL